MAAQKLTRRCRDALGWYPVYLALTDLPNLACHSRRYDREGEPEFASARLWDDGVIDPADTRRVLALALAAARNGYRHSSASSYGVFRM